MFSIPTLSILCLQLKSAIHQSLSPHDTLPPLPLSYFSGEFKGVRNLGLNAPLKMSALSDVFSQTKTLMKTVHAAAVDQGQSRVYTNQLVTLLRYFDLEPTILAAVIGSHGLLCLTCFLPGLEPGQAKTLV